jgi:hypothetical protein
MTEVSITAILLRAAVRAAWGLNSMGMRVVVTGEALEGWAERTAEKHGIDILNALAPLTDRRGAP